MRFIINMEKYEFKFGFLLCSFIRIIVLFLMLLYLFICKNYIWVLFFVKYIINRKSCGEEDWVRMENDLQLIQKSQRFQYRIKYCFVLLFYCRVCEIILRIFYIFRIFRISFLLVFFILGGIEDLYFVCTRVIEKKRDVNSVFYDVEI